MFKNSYTPSLKLRSRRIIRRVETAETKTENVVTNSKSSSSITTHNSLVSTSTTTNNVDSVYSNCSQKQASTISADIQTSTTTSTVLNDYVNKTTEEVEDDFFEKFDDLDLDESIIFPSTISPTMTPRERSLSPLPSKSDQLIELLNRLTAEENTEKTWSLFETQRGGYKLASMGFYYIVDKPTLRNVPNAEKIYWKCEKSVTCLARATSNGLTPPLVITKEHTHLPLPEKLESLKIMQNTKQLAASTNTIPRNIIRNATLGASEDAIALLSKPQTIRQMIKRYRVKKFGLKEVKAKNISQVEIQTAQRLTHNDDKFYWDDIGAGTENRIIILTS